MNICPIIDVSCSCDYAVALKWINPMNRAIARDVTTTPLRHFGAQPDFAVYGRDGELCCC